MSNCFWPIIYVRGYAMSRGEIDEASADPFCGFNVGSTVMRARTDKSEPARKFVFESPVVRLQSDYQYCDVYEDGVDIADREWGGTLALRSIIIHRYYDEGSALLGSGQTPTIEECARGLSELILRVKAHACENAANAVAPEDFRCYLVAHSMGGLVCRAFLQNAACGSDDARRCIDKFFTYATPHNGIEFGGRNVPSWLTAADISNFSRERMAKYLDLEELYHRTGRVDWMPEWKFPSSRVFCMVGTNRSDYEAAAGMSRAFVGHGSDGLVRIDNASVWGVDRAGNTAQPSATAFAYRAHSGYFGIVNSEEAYQNLVRFLFGDVRIDIWVDIDAVTVPQELEEADAAGTLDALYQLQVVASPRGKRWYLTRRTPEEDSVACRRHIDIRNADRPNARHVHLSTVFLAKRYRVDQGDSALHYGLDFGVRVPDYEVDKRFWPNAHYEGQYLFHDGLTLAVTPPEQPGAQWDVRYSWQSRDVAQTGTNAPVRELDAGRVEIALRFASSDASPPRSPGIEGTLRFIATAWNAPIPRLM